MTKGSAGFNVKTMQIHILNDTNWKRLSTHWKSRNHLARGDFFVSICILYKSIQKTPLV